VLQLDANTVQFPQRSLPMAAARFGIALLGYRQLRGDRFSLPA